MKGKPMNEQVAVGVFCPVCEIEVWSGDIAKAAKGDRLVVEHLRVMHGRTLPKYYPKGEPEVLPLPDDDDDDV